MADLYIMPYTEQKDAALKLLGKFHFTARDFGFLFKNIDIFNLIENFKICNPRLEKEILTYEQKLFVQILERLGEEKNS